jgi:hypothetical protein
VFVAIVVGKDYVGGKRLRPFPDWGIDHEGSLDLHHSVSRDHAGAFGDDYRLLGLNPA